MHLTQDDVLDSRIDSTHFWCGVDTLHARPRGRTQELWRRGVAQAPVPGQCACVRPGNTEELEDRPRQH